MQGVFTIETRIRNMGDTTVRLNFIKPSSHLVEEKQRQSSPTKRTHFLISIAPEFVSRSDRLTRHHRTHPKNRTKLIASNQKIILTGLSYGILADKTLIDHRAEKGMREETERLSVKTTGPFASSINMAAHSISNRVKVVAG
jgi:hypothetical protein